MANTSSIQCFVLLGFMCMVLGGSAEEANDVIQEEDESMGDNLAMLHSLLTNYLREAQANYVDSQDFDDEFDSEGVSEKRGSLRPMAKSFKYIGLGKRKASPMAKSFKFIGLGKRGDPMAKSFKYIGLGKRAGPMEKSFKYIGLGKRDPMSKSFKYIGLGRRANPMAKSFKYIGLGKRRAGGSPMAKSFKYIGIGKRSISSSLPEATEQ